MLHFDHFFVTYQILQSSDGLCNLENFLSCATLTHICILPQHFYIVRSVRVHYIDLAQIPMPQV